MLRCRFLKHSKDRIVAYHSYIQHTHTRLDRVEEHGSCNGLVQADEGNKRVRPTIVTATLLISGWARSMRRMDWQKVMEDLLNDLMFSQRTNILCSYQRYSCLFTRSAGELANVFLVCKMRDSHIQPNMHTAKPFFKMGLHFPVEPIRKNYGVC